ncbi:MAG: Stp1/IreP family PP2C-type Ser/Thr phosphatase [Clostridiales bacterium]|nr:Stp1/IreP family PP2C-type Ser/Thr phosphatase [Clostridiales bacterium]
MRYYLDSDKGIARKNNEDSVFFDENHRIFIIADGMGGHNAGEVASKMAIETFVDFLTSIKEFSALEMLNAISSCNNIVYEASLKNDNYKGMGTTFTAAHINTDLVSIIHVGDTRAYKIAENDINQITEDHTLVAQLHKSGRISRDEALNHPNNHILIKALGTKNTIVPTIYSEKFKQGDYLVMTSDGVTDLINDNELKNIVNLIQKPENIVKKLIEAANDKGGKDNISIICVKFDGERELKR